MVIATIETIKVAAADISFTFLALILYLNETISTKFSIAVLINSRDITKPITRTIIGQDEILIFIPNEKTITNNEIIT